MATKSTKKKFPRKKASGKTSIIGSQCLRYVSQVTTGILVAIDPSSGSDGSQPGYAIFDGMKLVEHGIVQIGTKRDSGLANRLYLLKNFLETEFPTPDVVCIERCPFRYANLAAARLQQMTGVVKSIWDAPVIEVSPTSWKVWVGSLSIWGLTYEKCDELDAVAIGACVIGITSKLEV